MLREGDEKMMIWMMWMIWMMYTEFFFLSLSVAGLLNKGQSRNGLSLQHNLFDV